MTRVSRRKPGGLGQPEAARAVWELLVRSARSCGARGARQCGGGGGRSGPASTHGLAPMAASSRPVLGAASGARRRGRRKTAFSVTGSSEQGTEGNESRPPTGTASSAVPAAEGQGAGTRSHTRDGKGLAGYSAPNAAGSRGAAEVPGPGSGGVRAGPYPAPLGRSGFGGERGGGKGQESRQGFRLGHGGCRLPRCDQRMEQVLRVRRPQMC